MESSYLNRLKECDREEVGYLFHNDLILVRALTDHLRDDEAHFISL